MKYIKMACKKSGDERIKLDEMNAHSTSSIMTIYVY